MTPPRRFTADDNLASQAAHRTMKTVARIMETEVKATDPEQLAMIEAKLAEMPVTQRKRYLKAINGQSQKAAIRAFCAECVCWVREEVTLCTAKACPLWPYRPYQKK